jgi:ribosomal protein L11 methyltransferase
MDYIQVSITGIPDGEREILMAQLAELGFESFTESEEGVQGFVPENLFNETEVNSWLQRYGSTTGIFFRTERIRAQNWNAIWESEYEPVVIDGKCMVRAPFHDPLPGMEFDLVIEPRMSFGTAHHETTSHMLGMLMEEDLRGKRVLDMGCGTAVLAILAYKMGAGSVVAIDNDEWAFSNAQDNIVRNNAFPVVVIQGDASSIPGPAYDVIIANINRNILLRDISVYTEYLAPSGVLFMSGFYEDDLAAVTTASTAAGLSYVKHKVNNRWVGVKYSK